MRTSHGAKRQAAAEAAVGFSFSEPPFSEGTRKARHYLSFSSPQSSLPLYPYILLTGPFVLDVVIFPHTYTTQSL